MEENKQPEELTEAAQEAAQIKEPEVDLTGQRNARVLPLVQRLFSKFSTFGFEFNDDATGKDTNKIKAENDSHDRFYEEAFIPLILERELKIKDLSYLFTMMKTSVSMMVEVLDEPHYTARVKDCALELFGMMAGEKTLNLAHTDDKAKNLEVYREMYSRLVDPLFKKYEIQYNEVSLVFTIMQALLVQVETRGAITIDAAKKVADANVYGIEDIDDLTVNRVQVAAMGDV